MPSNSQFSSVKYQNSLFSNLYLPNSLANFQNMLNFQMQLEAMKNPMLAMNPQIYSMSP